MKGIYDYIPDIDLENFKPLDVYDNDVAYRNSPSISNSDLPFLAKSYNHYSGYKNSESKKTKAMDLGTLTHHLMLQPQLFYRKAVMSEYEEFRTNESKAWRDAVLAEKKFILKPDEAKLLNDLRDGLWSKKWIIDNLVTTDKFAIEQDIYFEWSDELPVPSRGKLDYVNYDKGYWIDIKTAAEIDEIDIRNITGRSYNRQATFYNQGLFRLTGKVFTPYFAFVEKHYPYGVKIFKISEDYMERTKPRIEKTLQYYWDCYNGIIEEVGYAEEPIEVQAPEWL